MSNKIILENKDFLNKHYKGIILVNGKFNFNTVFVVSEFTIKRDILSISGYFPFDENTFTHAKEIKIITLNAAMIKINEGIGKKNSGNPFQFFHLINTQGHTLKLKSFLPRKCRSKRQYLKTMQIEVVPIKNHFENKLNKSHEDFLRFTSVPKLIQDLKGLNIVLKDKIQSKNKDSNPVKTEKANKTIDSNSNSDSDSESQSHEDDISETIQAGKKRKANLMIEDKLTSTKSTKRRAIEKISSDEDSLEENTKSKQPQKTNPNSIKLLNQSNENSIVNQMKSKSLVVNFSNKNTNNANNNKTKKNNYEDSSDSESEEDEKEDDLSEVENGFVIESEKVGLFDEDDDFAPIDTFEEESFEDEDDVEEESNLTEISESSSDNSRINKNIETNSKNITNSISDNSDDSDDTDSIIEDIDQKSNLENYKQVSEDNINKRSDISESDSDYISIDTELVIDEEEDISPIKNTKEDVNVPIRSRLIQKNPVNDKELKNVISRRISVGRYPDTDSSSEDLTTIGQDLSTTKFDLILNRNNLVEEVGSPEIDQLMEENELTDISKLSNKSKSLYNKSHEVILIDNDSSDEFSNNNLFEINKQKIERERTTINKSKNASPISNKKISPNLNKTKSNSSPQGQRTLSDYFNVKKSHNNEALAILVSKSRRISKEIESENLDYNNLISKLEYQSKTFFEYIKNQCEFYNKAK